MPNDLEIVDSAQSYVQNQHNTAQTAQLGDTPSRSKYTGNSQSYVSSQNSVSFGGKNVSGGGPPLYDCTLQQNEFYNKQRQLSMADARHSTAHVRTGSEAMILGNLHNSAFDSMLHVSALSHTVSQDIESGGHDLT